MLRGSVSGWDSVALPDDHWRSLHNTGSVEALALLITQGNDRKAIAWSDEVLSSAAAHGLALDASGHVALKQFVDRSQR